MRKEKKRRDRKIRQEKGNNEGEKEEEGGERKMTKWHDGTGIRGGRDGK